MKKKILFGSIFAVVILILLSFTNVIGYRTNSSDSVEVSPLFSVRTNRAIEQDNNIFSNCYIGMEKENTIQFPSRDNEKELMCKYIDAINQMDDNSFKNLITKTISQVNKDDKLKEIGAKKVLLVLNLMRAYPDELKSFILNGKEDNKNYTVGLKWIPGCYLLSLIFFIVRILDALQIIIIFFIYMLLYPLIRLDEIISAIAKTMCFGTCLAWTCAPPPSFCYKGDCIKS